MKNNVRFCDYHNDFIKPETGVSFHYFNSMYNDLHTHNYWEFLLVLDGALIQNINEKIIPLKKNDLYIVRPFDTHVFLRIEEKNSQYINIMITPEKLQNLCKEISPHLYEFLYSTDAQLCFHLSNRQYRNFQEIIDKLYLSALNQTNTLHFFICDVLKLAYFGFPSENTTSKTYVNNDTSSWIHKLMDEMNSIENMTLSLDEICSKIPISRVHINRLFRKEIGMSLGRYFTTIKFKYAACLLCSSNLNVLEIASNVGYSSLSYFNKMFKRIYNCTPKEYRMNNSALAQ